MDKSKPKPPTTPQTTDETSPAKKTKKKITCVKFCDNFGDYSENTTIHGVKYLGAQERPVAEKIWWIIGFVICIVCLGYFIYIIVDKWQKSPVIVTTDNVKTSIYKIPFPAVTICPVTKIQSKLFNYTTTIKKLRKFSELPANERPTNESIKYFAAISHVCNYRHLLSTDQTLWKGQPFMDKSDVSLIHELAPNFNDLFVACKFGNETDCNKIFSPIITDDGWCYTFNIVSGIFRNTEVQNDYFYFDSKSPMKHWSIDGGYTNGAIDDAHPKRAMAMGRRRGLLLTLRSYNENLNYLCRNGDQGYKVSLHNPTGFPQTKKHYVHVQHGQDASISITPKTIKTASTINSYSPERRQCYFNHERSLRFFLTYNQMNCKLECVSNYTNSACDCVKFSLPRGRGTSICGPEKIGCYAPIWTDWENHMLRKQFVEEYFGKTESRAEMINAIDKCNCLPECSMVEYATQVDVLNFNLIDKIGENPELLKTYEDGTNRTYQITEIDIHFMDIKFYGETRSELYGISDLVANFGGLLGLFMGGSLLSLVELLYFCTIRNVCNYRRSNKSKDVI